MPELDLTGIVGAAYNPTDGILFPWPFLWGYARQAAAHGVRIFTQTAGHRARSHERRRLHGHDDRAATCARAA